MGNISSVIQIIALGAFLVGFAGIGLVVMSASQGRPVRNGISLAIIGLVGGVLLTVVSSGILVVPPTRSAVVINVLSGELEEPARAPGTSIVIPGIQEFRIYPTDQQEYTMSGIPTEGRQQGNDAVEALTVDGQSVFIDITVIYRIDRDNVNTVHLKWQDRYEDQFIRPQVRAISRDVVSEFEAEAIYGVDRQSMQEQIQARLATVLAEDGLTLSNLLVRQIRFNDEFAQSIERKQIEEQELQRARTEAQRVQTQAQGQADAAIESARGDAEARLIQAQAEAEALRLISEQIAANPNLISFEYIQQLADNVNLALIPSNSPFLFDADSFIDVGDDFEAPAVPEPVVPEVPSDDDTTSD